jgi:hypothetical protein
MLRLDAALTAYERLIGWLRKRRLACIGVALVGAFSSTSLLVQAGGTLARVDMPTNHIQTKILSLTRTSLPGARIRTRGSCDLLNILKILEPTTKKLCLFLD